MEKMFKMKLNAKTNEYRIEGYKGIDDKEIVIPQKYNGIPITSINKKLFSHCAFLESIDIQAKISELPACTFSYCTDLKNVKLPRSIKMIGESAFEGCESLKKVDFPKQAKYAFSAIRNSGIEEFDIPKSMKEIPCEFFVGANIKEIVIPSWIKRIGLFCFRQSKIEKVVIQNGLKKISREFQDCPNLKGICLPPSIEYIDPDAFIIWEYYRPATITGKPDMRYSLQSRAIRNPNLIVYAEPGSYAWSEMRGRYSLKDIKEFDYDGNEF